jgi:enamine deaminase RidA (YjgF/YER057c/UK114 family)
MAPPLEGTAGQPPAMPSPAQMKKELATQLRMAYSELKRAAAEAGIEWREIISPGGGR